MYKYFIFILLMIISLAEESFSFNEWNDSYEIAKDILEQQIYTTDGERKTLYCNAQFYEDKSVDLPLGFIAEKYKNRINRIEWEHVVPAENFGRTFPE